MSNLRRIALPAGVILATAMVGGSVAAANGGIVAAATGSGEYALLGTAPTAFDFGAVAHANGKAAGTLSVSTFVQGFTVAFEGQVTCVSVDAANDRAWIGGVVTSNTSDHPSYTTPRTQVGQDIWFRVVDYGEGNGAPADRSTFVGFAGDAEIQTSAEYCAVQPWPADDARTWAVTSGNISVHD